MTDWKSMTELAEEYTEALEPIRRRLQELRAEPEENAVRIRDLEQILHSTREIRNTIRDYYKKWAWLNEHCTVRYTLQRTDRGVPSMADRKRRRQRRVLRAATPEPVDGHPERIDCSTAGSIAALLIRGPSQ